MWSVNISLKVWSADFYFQDVYGKVYYSNDDFKEMENRTGYIFYNDVKVEIMGNSLFLIEKIREVGNIGWVIEVVTFNLVK